MAYNRPSNVVVIGNRTIARNRYIRLTKAKWRSLTLSDSERLVDEVELVIAVELGEQREPLRCCSETLTVRVSDAHRRSWMSRGTEVDRRNGLKVHLTRPEINLRIATRSMQCFRSDAKVDSIKLASLGFSEGESRKCWAVDISKGGQTILLGAVCNV